MIGNFGGAVVRDVAGGNLARAPAGRVDVVEADTGAHRDPGLGKGSWSSGDIMGRRIVYDRIDRLAHRRIERGRLVVGRAGEDELDVGIVLAFELSLVGGLPVGAKDLHACPSDFMDACDYFLMP